jgi:ABC-type transport system involved in multi-copper enzyme maturation permease subunit
MPIFDQGYQHWTGPLSGHAWRWVAVARHGVRAVLQNRAVRLMLVAAWLPAIALVTVLAVWGLLEQQSESVVQVLERMLPKDVIDKPAAFRSAVWTIAYSFFFKAELAAALFLVLVVGPNLVSRDLRFNALPLYFARPLRRFDYFLGKLGVIAFFLAATAVVPAATAYLLGVAFSLDFGVVKDTYRLLWAGTLYGLIIAVSAGTLMLALSSLSRRSIYVGLAWAGFVFLTLMLSGILIAVRRDAERNQVVRAGIADWLKDHPAPAGVRMSGPYPVRRFTPPRPGGAADPADLADPNEQWYRDWSREFSRLNALVEATRAEDSRTDWRPLVAYSTNLDRLGDWLLDTDTAWVTIGRAVERPRAAFGPAIRMQAGGRLPRELSGPANDRLLADRLVWQFPWYWSAGVLGGLWLLSAFVLTRRVKSLDRLK